MSHESCPSSPESMPDLRYPEGWREILEAPDAIDYQMWLKHLAELTQQRLREAGIDVEEALVNTLWQKAIEQVADAAIDPDGAETMTQAEIVETALITLKFNIDSMGWDEEGVAFTVPNMFTGEAATIDLRDI